MATSKAPAWGSKVGPARIQQEFRSLNRSIQSGAFSNVHNLHLVDSDLRIWRFELHAGFDEDVEGGRALNADLRQLELMRPGTGHILMEVRFPDDYPHQPFFLRVVRPRFQMYTGHVTAGGSICIEMLTNLGSSNSWRPELCVEAVLTQVIINFITAERVLVRTTTGPGGMSGPLRVDFSSPHASYSVHEAQSAFQRMERHHRLAGWDTSGGSQVALHMQGGAGPSAAQTSIPAPAAAMAALAISSVHQARLRRSRKAAVAAAALPSEAKPAVTGQKRQAEVMELLSSEDEATSSQTQHTGNPKRHQSASSAAAASVSLPTIDLTALPARPAKDRALQAVQPQACSPRVPPRREPTLKERLEAANTATGLDLAMPPDHWDISDSLLRGERIFVELPLPAGTAGAAGDPAVEGVDMQALGTLVFDNQVSQKQALRALKRTGNDVDAALAWLVQQQVASAAVDQQAIEELLLNEVSQADAEAALRHTGNNVDQALLYCFECNDQGGPAAVERRRQHQERAREEATRAQKRKEDEARRRLLDEATAVLERFEEHGGVSRKHVLRIERVQNLMLWSDYERRRRKMAHELRGPASTAAQVAAAINEQQLWHGADTATLAVICREGFDMRVSNLFGTLGGGSYFAQSSSYSHNYSSQPAHSANAAPSATIGLGAIMQALLPGVPAAPGAVPAPSPVPGPSPAFLEGAVAMLLCKVALGRSAATTAPNRRRPPEGHHSTQGSGIWAVYDNHQAYPEYVVHYKMVHNQRR